MKFFAVHYKIFSGNRVIKGGDLYRDTQARTIIKSITWRFLATLTTIIIVYVSYGEFKTAVTIGGVELILKLTIYYFHERAWLRIKAGKHEIKPFVLWITGYPGSGKKRLADMIEVFIRKQGFKVENLQGKNFHDIFADEELNRRAGAEEIKRIGYFASMLEKNGVFVLAPFFSPTHESRKFVRSKCLNYIEIHVTTPIDECRLQHMEPSRADWRKWQREYEEPKYPELKLDMFQLSDEEAFEQVKKTLVKYI